MCWQYTATSFRGGYSHLVPWLHKCWNDRKREYDMVEEIFKGVLFSRDDISSIWYLTEVAQIRNFLDPPIQTISAKKSYSNMSNDLEYFFDHLKYKFF